MLRESNRYDPHCHPPHPKVVGTALQLDLLCVDGVASVERADPRRWQHIERSELERHTRSLLQCCDKGKVWIPIFKPAGRTCNPGPNEVIGVLGHKRASESCKGAIREMRKPK